LQLKLRVGHAVVGTELSEIGIRAIRAAEIEATVKRPSPILIPN